MSDRGGWRDGSVDLSLIPSTHIVWLTTACKSSCKGSDLLFSAGTTCMCTHTCTHIGNGILKNNGMNNSYLMRIEWVLLSKYSNSCLEHAVRLCSLACLSVSDGIAQRCWLLSSVTNITTIHSDTLSQQVTSPREKTMLASKLCASGGVGRVTWELWCQARDSVIHRKFLAHVLVTLYCCDKHHNQEQSGVGKGLFDL